MIEELIARLSEKFQQNLDSWAILGFIAQMLFASRFLVQWIISERQGRSVIPIAFWYLSIIGSAGLLVYAIGRSDPVFILGPSLASIIYVRNLMLVHRERRAAASPDPTPDP